jgi:hypothetical protein
MAWMISNALMMAYENSRCSLELAVESLEATCLDGEQSQPLNGCPTKHLYLPSDKMKDFSRLSRSGMTFGLLTAQRSEDVLTWCLAGFRAKTSAAQEREQELQASAPACGVTWRESLAKFDPLSRSWKIPQGSLVEGSGSCLETWPRWGMTLNGVAYQQPALGPIMSATEYGSLLPTPTCHNAKEGAYPAEYTRKTPTLATHVGGKIHPEFTEWMMGWPIGWTDLNQLGMGKFLEWQHLHSKCYQNG